MIETEATCPHLFRTVPKSCHPMHLFTFYYQLYLEAKEVGKLIVFILVSYVPY